MYYKFGLMSDDIRRLTVAHCNTATVNMTIEDNKFYGYYGVSANCPKNFHNTITRDLK